MLFSAQYLTLRIDHIFLSFDFVLLRYLKIGKNKYSLLTFHLLFLLIFVPGCCQCPFRSHSIHNECTSGLSDLLANIQYHGS